MDLSPTWGRKRTWRRKKGRALEEKGMALGKRAWRWEKGAWRGAMLKGAGGNTTAALPLHFGNQKLFSKGIEGAAVKYVV